MRVLVCGGRNYDNFEAVCKNLEMINWHDTIDLLIQGGASGADDLARKWATNNGVAVQTFNADWKKWGKSAGPIRNEEMLIGGRPDLVVAFPGGRGTADMVMKAKMANIDVMEFS